MLTPKLRRALTVDPSAHPRGQPHLSAASGLAVAGPFAYLVADDEHHLGQLHLLAATTDPVRLHRLQPGDLPAGQAERKRSKPDLEALALLPARAAAPHGSLFALGSGSTDARTRAWHWPLTTDGAPAGTPTAMDLAAWFEPLRARYADLNIEGAFVSGDALVLLQRANKGQGRNAWIEFALPQMLAWVAGDALQPPAQRRSGEPALGTAGGVPYGFTDGVAWPGGGWLFSAVAEDNDDSYQDGACAASALGRVSATGDLLWLRPLAGAPKVEGIAWDAEGGLLLVTDADDPDQPSQLLSIDHRHLAG